jgi:hypothetical protein
VTAAIDESNRGQHGELAAQLIQEVLQSAYGCVFTAGLHRRYMAVAHPMVRNSYVNVF